MKRYRGPLFGFASRNFYAEFLAALDVERGVQGRTSASSSSTRPSSATRSSFPRRSPGQVGGELRRRPARAARRAEPRGRQRRLPRRRQHPARLSAARPAGHRGRLSAAARADRADARVVAVPRGAQGPRDPRRVRKGAVRKSAGQGRRSYRTHRVGKGQTLSDIAERYRVSVQRLRAPTACAARP